MRHKGRSPGLAYHMSIAASSPHDERDALERMLGQLRPKLHRYCARMTGSVVDGEDVLQEALVKALEAFPRAQPIENLQGWLFRIAHNAALDFLRRRTRQNAAHANEELDMVVDPTGSAEQRQIAAASLRTFMRLPVAQRSAVILMDVLGYSLEEIVSVMDSTVAAVKAALNRGRARLRELAREPDDAPVPVLPDGERALLAAYVDRFNARDFDAIRNMLADEVRLDLVAKLRLKGRAEVASYFHNYAKVEDWFFVAGMVEGRPAALVRSPADASAPPGYFVLLDFADGHLANIRDFRFARYAAEGAELVVLD
jgi:RNA polymerase sigma-70 factor, ECF subfamily